MAEITPEQRSAFEREFGQELTACRITTQVARNKISTWKRNGRRPAFARSVLDSCIRHSQELVAAENRWTAAGGGGLMRFFRIWNACLGMTPQTEEESLTAQEWVLINEQVRDLAPTENFVPHNRNH